MLHPPLSSPQPEAASPESANAGRLAAETGWAGTPYARSDHERGLEATGRGLTARLQRIAAWPAPTAAVVCLLLLALVSIVDIVTGARVEFALFYFLPIIVASLRFDARGGLPVALVSAVLTRMPGPTHAVPLSVTATNMLTEAVVYSLVALVTAALQRQGQRLRAQRQALADAQHWLQEDLRAAELLQDHLLRRPIPAVPGLEVAVELIFARGVGGDFYDLRRIDLAGGLLGRSRPCLAVCVADVSGKGARAALISAALRGLLDEASGKPSDPGAFLRHMNARLWAALPEDMFVTMFYGCLDLETGELQYASAGHDAPFLCRGRQVTALEPTAPALGMVPELPAESEQIVLQPGETIFLYTDGLTTARYWMGGRVGEERVAGWLRERMGLPPAELVAEILHLACPEGEAPLEDDVALIALRRQAVE